MAKPKKSGVNRRGFLKGTAVGAAALVTPVPLTQAQQPDPQPGTAALPSSAELAAETEPLPPDSR